MTQGADSEIGWADGAGALAPRDGPTRIPSGGRARMVETDDGPNAWLRAALEDFMEFEK
ncbi:hypothetical protein SMD11_4591 [Streptomyces albireticuli]|uniref:Uncharacterized protein n=1 Tax=Streptomyces albireticuli TaxID=1940 RepID=A0A1Z2L7F6_9ACTN|nr:hypothetical protein SMD11_4591 [Streptomyces albireticuli]